MIADLVIRGGLVYDGLGSTPQQADVAVTHGTITAVANRIDMEALRIVDAEGSAVAPGFIDMHTHSDVSLLLDGRAESKVHQGVTTDVTGNCGFSPFPVDPQRLELHADLLAGLGDDPVELLWTDLAGYTEAIRSAGIAINIAPLVGHGALRIASMGLAERAPTNSESSRMVEFLERALDQGAFGLSTGLTYVPSGYASTPELVALCRVLQSQHRLYATHARSDADDRFSSVREALALGRETGVAVQYSHAAINDPKDWGSAPAWISDFDAAREEGVDAAFDVYPYDASSSALSQYLPTWVQQGGVAAMRARLAERSLRLRALIDLAKGWDQGRIPWFWDRVLLARTDGVLDAPEGQTIEAAAGAVGWSEEEYMLELCLQGGNRVQVVLFYRTEDDMRTFLRSERSLVGSDGSALPYDQGPRRPHPRAFGAHARVLGRYARDLGDVDLQTAVSKMTGAVAKRLGISDRGTLAPGKAADIVVFDPLTISDRATYLDPCQPPTGILYVVVNGQLVIEAGRHTDARPGRILQAA
ncbi:MAG: N-acyl-D-amino-acid deacylase family protein [Acidimicrobiales bacterium]